MPMFKELPQEASAPLVEVADWLSGHIVDDSSTESMVSSPTHSAGSRGSWEAPLPPAGQIVQGAPRQRCLPTLHLSRAAFVTGAPRWLGDSEPLRRRWGGGRPGGV